MSETPSPQELVLKMPVGVAFAKLVTVGVAAMGDRLEMTTPEVEEMSAALEGATAILAEVPRRKPASILARFVIEEGVFQVELRRTDGAVVPADAAKRLAGFTGHTQTARGASAPGASVGNGVGISVPPDRRALKVYRSVRRVFPDPAPRR